MKILLVSATEFEIEPFLNNKDIDILICGIGSPATIYHLTKKLFESKYDLVIQAGIAGTFSKKIKKGETIVIQKDVFADIGAEEKGEFKTVFQLGFGHENKFPYTSGWLNNDSSIFKTLPLKKYQA